MKTKDGLNPNQRYRLRHRVLGLCERCGNIKALGRSLCENHLKATRETYARKKDGINLKKRERRKNDPMFREQQRAWDRGRIKRRREVALLWRAKRRDHIRQREKLWRENNPDRAALHDLRKRLKRLDVSFDEYRRFDQRHCAICGGSDPGRKRRRFFLDHCHTTGRLRGLLCLSCNLAIGHLRNDPELARRAAIYLEEHARNNISTRVS